MNSAGAPALDRRGQFFLLSRGQFWAILLAAWVLRLAVGLGGDQMLHPDEVFQYLEPAHGIVFGSQLISWEFIVGARSYLIPGFVAGILHVLNAVGLGSPEFYIPAVKVAFCTLSLLLPVSMLHIGRNMFGETAGTLAFLTGCFWYELVGFAHKPLSDMVSCYFAFAGFALASGRAGNFPAAAWGGAAMALAVGLRYQTALLAAPLAIFALFHLNPTGRLGFAAGGLAGLFFVGLADHFAWGGFFHSYLLNIEIHIRAGEYWGSNRLPAHSFLVWVGLASLGMAWLAIGWGLKNWRRYWPLLLPLGLFFAAHSWLTHKEYRFFFPWIPLWLLIASDLAGARVQNAHREGGTQLRGIRSAVLLAPLAGASILGISNSLPLQADLYRTNLISDAALEPEYRFFRKDPGLRAYIDLGNDEDVRGLIDASRQWSFAGGYYYFHKKVPLHIETSLLHAVTQAGQEADRLTQFATHLLSLPSASDDSGLFEQVRRTGNYALWRVKPEHREEIRQLSSHRYAPYSPVELQILDGWMEKYILPKDDFELRLAE